MRKNFWAYIATNKTHTTLYTGVTNDLERRMWEHKHRTNPKSFTARYSINRLVWCEHIPTAADAIACEKRIKGLMRAKKETIIRKLNPLWNDLARVGMIKQSSVTALRVRKCRDLRVAPVAPWASR